MALADASLSLVQLCESRPSSLITAAMSFHCLTSFASFVFSPPVLIDIRYEYRLQVPNNSASKYVMGVRINVSGIHRCYL